MADPKPTQDQNRPPPPGDQAEHPTSPDQEWGERVETGKAIARGGKTEGDVSGTDDEPAGQ